MRVWGVNLEHLFQKWVLCRLLLHIHTSIMTLSVSLYSIKIHPLHLDCYRYCWFCDHGRVCQCLLEYCWCNGGFPLQGEEFTQCQRTQPHVHYCPTKLPSHTLGNHSFFRGMPGAEWETLLSLAKKRRFLVTARCSPRSTSNQQPNQIGGVNCWKLWPVHQRSEIVKLAHTLPSCSEFSVGRGGSLAETVVSQGWLL